jgi:hypothetical protein
MILLSYVRHCAACLFLAALVAADAFAGPPPLVSQSTDTGLCRWLGASGDELLVRRVSQFSVKGADVETAIAELSTRANLPLSFIQEDGKDAPVTLEMRDATVRQILDELVARTPSYRYSLIAGRLVLYPRDPKWETQIEDIHLGPAPRVQVAHALAKELSRRLPAFADLVGPWVLGDSRAYTYQDQVSVAGPGSVLELLVQLLGNRPSTFLLLDRNERTPFQSLSVSSRDQLETLKLTAPAMVLRRRDETVQLKLVGTLKYGSVSVNLTPGECGTIYEVGDEQVIGVSADGLVTARGNGEASVRARVERLTDQLILKVDLPKDNP